MVRLLIDAILVGVFLSIPLSFFSYFIVMRKMTFAGVGIAHATFGGIAIGFLLGFTDFIFPLLFCVASAFFVGYMYKKGGFSEDSIIDVVFVFSMALGIFIFSMAQGYSGNVIGLLFGDILSVSQRDVFYSLFVSLAALFFILYYFSHLHLITFNEDLAKINGVNTDFLYYSFWVMLSVLIVFSIKLMGIILVNAFLVLPALVGLNVSTRFRGVILFGVLSSLLALGGGVLFSYYLNTPTGATIVLLFFLLWLISFVFRH